MNEAGQDAGDQAERGEEEHRGEREAVGLVRAVRPRACAARPRKVTPNALTKQAAASAADSASSAPTAGTRNFSPHDGSCGLSRIAWKVSHSETKPLSGGSAEIADAADQEHEGGLRHAVDQAAELLHVALAGRASARRRRRRTAGS